MTKPSKIIIIIKGVLGGVTGAVTRGGFWRRPKYGPLQALSVLGARLVSGRAQTLSRPAYACAKPLRVCVSTYRLPNRAPTTSGARPFPNRNKRESSTSRRRSSVQQAQGWVSGRVNFVPLCGTSCDFTSGGGKSARYLELPPLYLHRYNRLRNRDWKRAGLPVQSS